MNESPVTTTEFIVPVARRKLWNLLNDLKAVGNCVTGCESVEILSPQNSKWRLKVSAGIISKRIDANAEIIERVEPERMVVKIESSDRDITGTWKLELIEQAADNTKVVFTADMNARGSFEWLVNQIIKNQFSKMANQFAACITEKAKAES